MDGTAGKILPKISVEFTIAMFIGKDETFSLFALRRFYADFVPRKRVNAKNSNIMNK